MTGNGEDAAVRERPRIWWPTATPEPFKDTDECYWRDGKPWCPQHHVVLVTTASVNLAYLDLTGTHVCYRCMTEHHESVSGRDAR